MRAEKRNDTLFIEIDDWKVGSEVSFLLTSDEHWDSKGCNRSRLKRDWQIAKENGWGILQIGDFFDVMGGKYDPRSHMKDVRPEYKDGGNYFDLIAQDGAKFLNDYPVMMMVEGNHEYTVRRKHEFDLLNYTTSMMDTKPALMPYDGFVRFVFSVSSTQKKKVDMFYTHGTGGSSPVTKGVIQTNRRQNDVLADLFVSGHIHQKWEVPKTVRYIDPVGEVKTKERLHVSLGTYKDERDQYGMMKGYGNVDVGGRKLTFYCPSVGVVKYEVGDVR